MPFNLGNLNPPTRIWYNEDEWVDLRMLSDGDVKDIRRQSRKTRIEYKQGQRFEVVDINSDLEDELIWDRCIVGWYLIDDNGTAIPCTKENKLLMMRGSVEFMLFVQRGLEQIRDEKRIYDEAVEKN